MLTFIVVITCLGQRYQLPALATHSFDAWLVAHEIYPQADSITVRCPTKGARHA